MGGFRYDINGLRAYAVALVVLYHFNIIGFNAGFIGVDIFFVISGYLMTSIVVKGIEKNEFNYLKFCASRAVRILPALLFLCISCLILFWFILLPAEYRVFGKHSLFSINFLSNFIYWTESGYFDSASYNKSLLHTWSLSVEWQFYLIYPIIIGIIYKIKRNITFLIKVLIGIFGVSLIYGIMSKDNSGNFFLIHTRAWEMIAGGLVFLSHIKSEKYSKYLEITGFILIGISCYFFSTETIWPSYNALVPVVGAVLILIADSKKSLLTRNKICQWLGDVSYSVYLWHWPIVFLIYYFYKNDNILINFLGILLSLFLGFISYKFVENPTRKYLSKLALYKVYLLWGAFILILSTVFYLVYHNNGYPKRWSQKIQNYYMVLTEKNPKGAMCVTNVESKSPKKCIYGTGDIRLIVIGDSHSNALLNGIIHSLPYNSSLIHWWIPNCATVIGLKRKDNPNFNCGNLVEKIIHEASFYNNVPVIVVNRSNALFLGQPENESLLSPVRYIVKPYNSYDDSYIEEMTKAYLKTLKKLRENHPVFVTTPLPEAKLNIPTYMSKFEAYKIGSLESLKLSNEDYMNRSKYTFSVLSAAKRDLNINIVDIHKKICDKKFCYFTSGDIPLYMDDDHFSWNGSLIFSDIFSKQIFNN